jgi:phospholipid/cholesterol/gamma-HCH transport system substrate-binding protein
MPTPPVSEFPLLRFEKKIWPAFYAALLLLLLLITAVAWRQNVFTPKTRFVCHTNTSEGLQDNMAVKLSGFRIGKVDKVELEGIGRVRLDLEIFTKYSRLLHKDSVAMLDTEGFIGQGVVVIVTSLHPGPEAEPGDELAFRRVESVIEMAQSLIKQVGAVTDDVHAMLVLFNSPDGLIHNLNSVTKQMDEMIPRLMADVQTTVQGLQKNLQETTGVTNQLLTYLNNPDGDLKIAVRNFKDSLADVHQDVPKLLEQLDHSLRNIEQTTSILRDTMKQASPDLVDTIHGAQGDVQDIHEVVDSAKKIWPLSSHLAEEAPIVLVPPSLPSASAAGAAKSLP